MVMAKGFQVPKDRTFDPPDWWTKRIKQAIEDDEQAREMAGEGDLTDKVLVEIVSEAAGRVPSWDRSKASNFHKGKNVTVGFAIGLSKLYGVPPPVYYARSEPEAQAFQKTAERFSAQRGGQFTPEQQANARTFDAARRMLESTAAGGNGVRDRGDALPSSPDGEQEEGRDRGGRSGRPGGVARRRKKAPPR